MTDRVIFTFWEPRESVIPYLALCRQTWEKNLPDYSVVVLDYANLTDYLGRQVYDMTLLKQLSLPTQKDAISVAVMQEHGGVFMDIDTLVFRDLDPILRMLDKTELVMFGSHMAFFAAKPKSRLLTLWLTGIQEKLGRLAQVGVANVPWDYVGNSTLAVVMDEIIDHSIVNRLPSRVIRRLDQFASRQSGRARGLARPVNWFCQGFLRRRKDFAFNTMYGKYLARLDRKKYKYILEARAFEGQHLRSEEEYVKYWFGRDGDPDAIWKLNPILVGLHNSWTPSWYKELSQKEVLENDCLLSRTLRSMLDSSPS